MAKVSFESACLTKEAVELLRSLGLSEEQLRSGVIDTEKDVPEDKKLLATDVFKLVDSVHKITYSDITQCDTRGDQFLRLRNFLASLDGKPADLSEKDISNFNDLRKNIDVITFFQTDKSSIDTPTEEILSKVGMGTFIVDGAVMLFLKDTKIYNDFLKYDEARDPYYANTLLLDSESKHIKNYLELTEAARARTSLPKTEEIVSMENGLKKMGVKDLRDILHNLPDTKRTDLVLLDQFQGDVRAISPASLEKLSDALALAKALDIKNGEGLLGMIKKYGNAGFRTVQSAFHNFVNPNKYPLPKGESPLSSDMVDEKVWESLVYALKDVRPENLPNKVKNVGESVIPIEVKFKHEELGRLRTGTLVCVGRSGGYDIFVTAAHVVRKFGEKHPPPGCKTKMINQDIALIAIPRTRDEQSVDIIKIDAKTVETRGPIYTIGDKGRFLFSKSGQNEDGRLTFTGLHKAGDSGSPVTNERGELIGIVLGGNKNLKVYAYSNMKELQKVIDDFAGEIKQ